MNPQCPMCKGTGRISQPGDLLLRPYDEKREYDEFLKSRPRIDCPLCNGTGWEMLGEAQ